jgi:Mg2+ and Co2+ transporter CorA
MTAAKIGRRAAENRRERAVRQAGICAAWLYEADGHDRELDLADEGLPRLSAKALLWIDLEAGNEAGLDAAAELLELSDELVTRLQDDEVRPSLADYEELIHVRVVEVSEEADSAPLPMDAVAGPNWLLTRHGRDGGYSESFRAAFQGETELGRLDSLSFLAALLEHLLGHYFAAIAKVEEGVDDFDVEAMRTAVADGEHQLARIVALRRTLAALRRSLVLHRDVYATLGDPDLTSLASKDSAERARALLDRLERAIDAAESARQMVAGSFEILMARTSQRTNDTMKILTLISAALLPSAVIAGVLGMNFKQSFFELSYLFWLVVALMAVLMVTVGVVARWRKWL